MSVRSALLVALLPMAAVQGQATWPGAPSGLVNLRVGKVFVTQEDGPDFATFIVTPGARIAIGRSMTLEVELPFARASEDFGLPPESVSGFAIGNPYIGLDLPTGNVRLQVGVRPGLAQDPDEPGDALALGYGFLTEFDRYEAYLPETSTIRFLAGFGTSPTRGQFAQLRIGGTALVQGGGGDGEVFADYGGRIGHAGDRHMIHVGILGRALLTSEEGGLAERTVHALAGGAALRTGAVQPSVELRYHLDEGYENARLVVLLGVAVVP